jgi:hypothetical protein
MRKIPMALAVMLGASFSLMADFIPYPNPGKIAPTQSFTATDSGDVIAYFYGSGAGYDDQLGLFVNGQQLGTWGLDNHTSTFGQSIDFGYVTAGTKLDFALNVLSTKTVLHSDPTLNPDGVNHTYGTVFSGQTKNGVTIPSGTYIGFEDLLASKADFNYSDEQFVLLDTTVTTLTPEPNPAWSLALGAICVGAGAFRRRKKPAALQGA